MCLLSYVAGAGNLTQTSGVTIAPKYSYNWNIVYIDCISLQIMVFSENIGGFRIY